MAIKDYLILKFNFRNFKIVLVVFVFFNRPCQKKKLLREVGTWIYCCVYICYLWFFFLEISSLSRSKFSFVAVSCYIAKLERFLIDGTHKMSNNVKAATSN